MVVLYNNNDKFELRDVSSAHLLYLFRLKTDFRGLQHVYFLITCSSDDL